MIDTLSHYFAAARLLPPLSIGGFQIKVRLMRAQDAQFGFEMLRNPSAPCSCTRTVTTHGATPRISAAYPNCVAPLADGTNRAASDATTASSPRILSVPKSLSLHSSPTPELQLEGQLKMLRKRYRHRNRAYGFLECTARSMRQSRP
jgi:hypothetical protein